MLGLRQELGKLAVAGTIIILLQLVCCPVTGWGFERALDRHFYVLVYTPALLGLAGVAVAALPAKGSSMRPLRFVVLGLCLVGIAGVLLASVGYVLATEIVDLRIDDPFLPMDRYTRLAGAYALVALTVLIALLARRPPDDPTAPGAHPQPPMHSQSEVSLHDASQPSMTSS